ncbi:dnaJ homolog subfamily C member 13 [Ischnura elegans]|uniref:dnaJ homolog subfamily C member 13 n=1 Tax=Ischnura elegans TaxID=197161 RepID=UPI001ED870E9|nr:dnaJ homolog subfamily C member 13 [Ischnura elegans]
MMPIKDNQDVACFYVTKHSWRGKYKRIFSVGTQGITTYNPGNLEVTNRWSHSDIFSVCPTPGDASEFVVAMRRNKDSGGGNSGGTGKADSMRFSSEHRAQILFQALRYRHLFATADQAAIKAEARDHYNAYKLHWSETRLPVMLRVGAASLDQLDPTTKVLLASYPYYKMESLLEVSGEKQGSFVVVSGGFGRMHLFTSNQSKEIMNKIVEAAPYYSGVQVRIQSSPITVDHFTENRLGKYSGDEHVTSVCEFTVQKVAAGDGMAGGDLLEGGKRHLEPQRRTLCLTATCLVERDPQTYAAVTLRPLSSICSIVRSPENPQLFALEYDCGQVRSYMATDRDSLLATLLDAVRASGNRDVHVRMGLTQRGKRLGPLNLPVDEEVESMHLRFLQQPPGRRTFAEMVERFNANVPYSGLIHSVTQDGLLADNKEKKITAALQALMQKAANNPSSPGGNNKAAELSDPVALMELEAQFHALRRLAASKVGFAAFTNLAGFREYMGRKVVYALRGGEEGVAQAALDTTCALMQPMHCQHVHMHQPQDIRQEQLNKSSLLSSRTFLASLLDMWASHVSRGTGALVVAAVLDFLTFALCVPYSETTDGTHFDSLLKMVAERGRSLFRLFQHPSLAIVKGAGLVMRAIVEEGEAEVAARMQDLALAEGALPRHLLAALFTIPPSLGDMASRAGNTGKNGPLVVDSRLLAHRQLSRHLVGLWVAGHPTAMGLLKRIMPAGLLAYLDSDEKVPPHEEEHILERDNLKLAQAESEGKGGSWGFRKPTAAQWANMERQLRLVEKQVERTLQHWSARVGFSPDWVSKSGIGSSKSSSAATDLSSRPIVLRKRRERIKSEANWPLFYFQFGRDHALPNLIWNHKTRDELRDALDNEVKSFVADREVASSGGTLSVSWNHAEFEVTYQCLADEIRIGDYYLRLLLERDGVNTGSLKAPSDNANQENSKSSSTSSSPIRRSYEFFNDLYHRFLLSAKPEMKCMCLQAMAIVYGRHHDDIGPFSDTKYIVEMLFRCMDRTERDRLLIFISNLALVRRNVKEFLDANGVRVLVDLLTLAHLHEGRATLTTAAILAGNTIEAAPKGQGESSTREEEKEWYYGGSSEEMKGPITFREMQKLWNENKLTARTRCWAQGMDGWRPLVQVPQLRWTLIAANSNPPVMDESRLATLILDTLIKMCNFFPSRDSDGAVIRPIPRVKRQISDPGVLPHLSQLLLTFEPGLVERVCTLLWESLRDNPGSAIALLHHTGAVYFALMYTGSNVLPVAKLLHLTHARLGANKNPNEDPGWPRGGSMLGQLLPEAMVSYLENHGPEKFAEIFLGEFDTPEAIWNTEMRRMMIERIAAHVADFSPRLRSNIRAQYVYCAIPAVRYPQLERELFCGIYYLRHLCDTTRFPEWPIARPVELLREILEAWRAEVEKKPPTMSIEEAYKVLGLERNAAKSKDKAADSKEGNGEGKGSLKRYDEAAVRKAYYRLAAKFHPDKNPDGRDQFEAVNKAYEFLCSRSAWSASDGPDPNNIVLILKAQSILFERYTEELHPYKYAGYPQLIKTIRIETSDERLFCKEAPLLAAATELAYHTLQCSAINAEELRRERGLDALLDAFSRCVSVIGESTAPTETAVHVCHNAIRCFTVAARFQACRDKMVEMTGLVPEICRVLRFKHLFRLCSSAVECVSALSVDGILQMQLLQWGALTRLLPTFFAYDYTLDEGGVTRSENANQQEVSNRLAKLAVGACARLGGYLQSEGGTEDDSFLPRETPANPVARAALSALLTPYLARQLAKDKPQELLKILTSNTENPYLIWNNGTRAELGEHLEEQGKRSWGGSEGGGDHALLADSSFKYSAHSKELLVGEVFLRIYNEQPTFPIENPKGLTIDLLEFIRKKSQLEQTSKPVDGSLIELDTDAVTEAEGEAERVQQVIMALRALENVIKNNPGVDIQCIGHFNLLFSLLRPEELSPGVGWCKCRPEVQSGALGVLAISSRNQQCVEDIAANGAYILPHLLMAIHCLPIGSQGSAGGAAIMVALDTFHALMSNPKIVKEALARGAIIYLLAIFCDVARGTARSGGVIGRAGASITLREKAAELLGKMSADKLVGGKVKLVLGKLLPPALADSFRGDTGSTLSAASCVEAFEARHANPELVWDDDARRQLCSAIGNLAEGHYKAQRENLSTIWRLPEESVLIEMLGGSSMVGGTGEAVVGGVYLRLYVANPNWQLRRPREFLTELLDTCLGIMSRDPKTVDVEFLDLCTNAIVALLKSQPALADQVPALGHLPRLCQLMGKSATALVPKSSSTAIKREDPVPKAAIQILHQISASQVCIEALSHTDCIAPLSAALRSPGLVLGDSSGGDVTAVACETLYRLFSANFDELVRQALHADLVPFLLSLLEGGGGTLVGGGAKAQVVKALKAMERSQLHGERVANLLARSPVWADYRDQRHDLFISGGHQPAYLTGAPPGVAGYLTQGTTKTLPDAPPPLDTRDDDNNSI